jgi:hypothetical protein
MDYCITSIGQRLDCLSSKNFKEGQGYELLPGYNTHVRTPSYPKRANENNQRGSSVFDRKLFNPNRPKQHIQ